MYSLKYKVTTSTCESTGKHRSGCRKRDKDQKPVIPECDELVVAELRNQEKDQAEHKPRRKSAKKECQHITYQEQDRTSCQRKFQEAQLRSKESGLWTLHRPGLSRRKFS